MSRFLPLTTGRNRPRAVSHDGRVDPKMTLGSINIVVCP
jgi:hypothetical protein